jgi:hypothetical protein
VQDQLDITYDDYSYDKSWSNQRLTTGAIVTASGLSGVTEKGYAVLNATTGDSHLVTTSGSSAPRDECDKEHVK